MSGRPQDTLRKRCGKFADRRTLTVVKEVTVVKEDLNTTHPPTYDYRSLAATPAKQGGWV